MLGFQQIGRLSLSSVAASRQLLLFFSSDNDNMAPRRDPGPNARL